MTTLSPDRALAPDATAAAPVLPEPCSMDLLLSDIRRRREEFTRLRHMAPDVVERFKQLGVYRALVPRALARIFHECRTG